MSEWTFLSDHAHVLVLLARNPRSDAPALARECGLGAAEIGAILRDLAVHGRLQTALTTLKRLDKSQQTVTIA